VEPDTFDVALKVLYGAMWNKRGGWMRVGAVPHPFWDVFGGFRGATPPSDFQPEMDALELILNTPITLHRVPALLGAFHVFPAMPSKAWEQKSPVRGLVQAIRKAVGVKRAESRKVYEAELERREQARRDAAVSKVLDRRRKQAEKRKRQIGLDIARANFKVPTTNQHRREVNPYGQEGQEARQGRQG
jgi:hypothetical protein